MTINTIDDNGVNFTNIVNLSKITKVTMINVDNFARFTKVTIKTIGNNVVSFNSKTKAIPATLFIGMRLRGC